MRDNLFEDGPQEARHARDCGMARVEANNRAWTEHVLDFIQHLPFGWEGITEDIRKLIGQSDVSGLTDIGRPKHPNAWGSVTRLAVERGLLRRTGEMRQPRSKPSHARPTQVWERPGISEASRKPDCGTTVNED